MSEKKTTLTIALISFNEEKRLPATLESVKNIADEIVLIDSHSTDSTLSIARSFNAIIFTEDWKGFMEQKNSLTPKSSMDWILFLDCDEEVTAALSEEILQTINSHSPKAGYFINRRTSYLGKLLKRSWQPDFKLRLVQKSAMPHWVGEHVHESLQIQGDTGNLKNEITHHSYKNIQDHMEKTLKYARLSAKDAFAKGKKASFAKIVFAPPLYFFKAYILKGGLIDGIQGLIAAFSAYVYFFLKYVFLWEMGNRHDK